MNLTVARGILKRYGIETINAASGQESIDLCKEQEFDIVFMDHMMPGMDGVEAMKRIRMNADRNHRNLPIVALTANAVSTAREMFIREGFDGFVSKPVELIELERVMKKVLPSSKWQIVKDSETGSAEMEQIPEKKTVGEPVTVIEDDSTEPAADDPYAALSKLGIDVNTGLRYSQGDRDFYKTLILQFASEGREKRQNAEKFLSQEAFSDYAIIVHAIKSTSKMIGAQGLSDKAKYLEDAAKAGRGDDVRASHANAMADYTRITEGILELFGDRDDSSDEEVLEFSPDEDEILEFGPEDTDESKSGSGDDEILEFGPEEAE